MQRFAETVDIDAEVERVWRALTVPDEVVCWDSGVVEAVDAPHDYPRAGQHVRWRYRLGRLPLILHDRPTRVETNTILCSDIRLGPFDLVETYTLRHQSAGTTQLTAELVVSSSVALVGTLLERLVAQPLARSTVHSSLAAIKHHCEQPR